MPEKGMSDMHSVYSTYTHTHHNVHRLRISNDAQSNTGPASVQTASWLLLEQKVLKKNDDNKQAGRRGGGMICVIKVN